jgi:MFS transporter, DHA1 family, multidrug resistance protein
MADSVREGTAKPQPLWDPTFRWFLFLYFLLNVGQGVFSPLLPQIMEDLGISFAAAGLLGTAYGLARSVVDLPAGLLLERLGTSRILHTAFALQIAGSILCAVAPSFAPMVLGRALIGIGSGLTMVVSILYLMRRAPSGHRGRRANAYEAATIGGMAVSAELAGLIGGRWGWRWSFAMAAGVMILAWGVAIRAVLPAIRHLLEDRPAPDAQALPPQPMASGPPGALLAIFTLIFTQSFAWGGGIATLFPLYGGLELGLQPEILGRTMAIAFWVEVVLLPPVGWAMDKWGKLRVIVPGFLAILLGSFLGPFTRRTLTFGLAYTLLVAGMSIWMAAPALLAEHLGPRFRGKAAGTYRLVVDVGLIFAPGLIGGLIDLFGFRTAGLALACTIAVSLALSLRFLRASQTHASGR